MARHLKKCAEDWKLGDYAKLFEFHLEDNRQTIAFYFNLVFDFMKSVLTGHEPGINPELVQMAKDTYETLCLSLTETKEKPEYPYLKRIVNHLFE